MVIREEIEFKVSTVENGLLIEYETWTEKLSKQRKRRGFIFSSVEEEEKVVEDLCEFIKDLFRRRCRVER